VGESAGLTEIKTAYRRLLGELHPDRNAEALAADRLKEVCAAYKLLEEYAPSGGNTFNVGIHPPVIVTVRSLEDLRAAGSAGRRRDPSLRKSSAGAEAA
jgi:hypothetical protein